MEFGYFRVDLAMLGEKLDAHVLPPGLDYPAGQAYMEMQPRAPDPCSGTPVWLRCRNVSDFHNP